MKKHPVRTYTPINRRQTLLVLGGAGASLFIAGRSNGVLLKIQN
jgi:hypothetical protein